MENPSISSQFNQHQLTHLSFKKKLKKISEPNFFFNNNENQFITQEWKICTIQKWLIYYTYPANRNLSLYYRFKITTKIRELKLRKRKYGTRELGAPLPRLASSVNSDWIAPQFAGFRTPSVIKPLVFLAQVPILPLDSASNYSEFQ